jgi:hypothetical protein
VRVWDLATGHQRHVLEGHTAEVTNLVLTPDATRLITSSRSQVCVIALDEPRRQAWFTGDTGRVTACGALTDLVVAGTSSGRLCFLSARGITAA